MFGKKDDKKGSSGTSAYVGNQIDKFLQVGEKEEVRQVPIEMISPNPFQPRKHFNTEDINSLAESIREKGIEFPIVIRRKDSVEQGTEYELVAGERRWRAAKIAGLARIPALIRPVSDKDSETVAFIENVHRVDLNAVEKMNAIASLLQSLGDMEAVIKATSLDPKTVARYLRIQKEIQLSPDFIKFFAKQAPKISVNTAEGFAKIAGFVLKLQKSNVREYKRIIDRINREGLEKSLEGLQRKFSGHHEKTTVKKETEYLKETVKDFTFHVRLKKNVPLSSESVKAIKESVETFLGILNKTEVLKEKEFVSEEEG